MRLAFFSTKPYDKIYFQQLNETYGHDITFFNSALVERTADLTKGFEAVCVFVNDTLDKPTIEKLAANKVKLIALRCAGFNNVDLSEAKKHQIKVVRVPAYSPQSVAEHALALIMTLNRKTHKAYNRVRECNFSLDNLTGFNIFGKTVGVIGTGQIGAAFCKIMLGLGCKVLAYDVHQSGELQKLGVTYQPIETLYAQSDIISLHCPLLPDTKHLINSESISSMKNGVMIINTSRGALINTKDIITALKKRKIGYLGIDVYEQEENLFFEDLSERIIEDDLILRLISFPNVLITSHQAFLTDEALFQIAQTVMSNIENFEKGEELRNEV
ncbi:2-hydroxyacid dehydrogenase [Flammeovirgaceae bacterium SG7u.111]|nr:2-hydroxyacid dehydrogenase [Flammeovirgaceae bacterium SG7u.132]WPO34046.1 2-hydroxyacid dehydrogenase [Flammeovirgaceae bacterium SG7u.111]